MKMSQYLMKLWYNIGFPPLPTL